MNHFIYHKEELHSEKAIASPVPTCTDLGV